MRFLPLQSGYENIHRLMKHETRCEIRNIYINEIAQKSPARNIDKVY